MITMLDHGNVSGAVSIDASTYRTHKMTLTGNITVGALTGVDDGEEVTFIFYSSSGTKSITWNAAYVCHSSPNSVDASEPFKVFVTKIGSDLV